MQPYLKVKSMGIHLIFYLLDSFENLWKKMAFKGNCHHYVIYLIIFFILFYPKFLNYIKYYEHIWLVNFFNYVKWAMFDRLRYI